MCDIKIFDTRLNLIQYQWINEESLSRENIHKLVFRLFLCFRVFDDF